ncbi:angiotensin-converting enzyme-like [Diprion similis]|uniref:angiotensin-converting enzyme-like n=1 Tax=Diprion similis TaxID=362088 RepID=UPI001EF99704|nr:angiotensin-converting enzyme-like [Diprion similis]
MSHWMISVFCAIAISSVLQTPFGFQKHKCHTKSRSPIRNSKASRFYTSGIEERRIRRSESVSKEIEQLAKGLATPDVFLELMNNLSTVEYHRNAIAQWEFESNINATTRAKALKSSAKLAEFQKIVWKAAGKYDWRNFNGTSRIKRQFEMISVLGSAVLSDDKFKQLDEVINKMESIYSTATIEPYVKIDGSSKSKKLRRGGGRKLRLEPDFSSVAQYWTNPYEDPNFEKKIVEIWQEVKPFYLELHAYVRNRLRTKYGTRVIPESGYIPAHVFGDMWTQSWIHLNKDTMPYPDHAIPDMTKRLKVNNFTKMEFFKLAEDFFRSLGFPKLPETFWRNSIIERPPNNKTELVCHGSAWDMYDGRDFRIKMCTEVTYDDLVIVHHEMGHVQYYIQYRDQPIVFREGANPGFHEAIGDTIALSVSSLPHACGLGLVDNVDYQPMTDINYLYLIALQKIAFLPFAYCVDKWRWTVFTDEVTPEMYNSLWWKFRAEIQGIEPPFNRDETDFDPGAKYHVAANVPYIRYFVSFIIQFQFHEAVCLNAGQYDPNDPNRPLHRCDIYGSREAGIAMRQMMKLGSSLPWQETMERFTGSREMRTEGITAYFRPLYDWLKQENARTREPVGF